MLATTAQTEDRVLGIVVTYKPDSECLDNLLKALCPQVDEVLIVDNTPRGEFGSWEILKGEKPVPANLRCVCLGENLGIAAAINIGLECMLEENFGYALLSDQDSVPKPDMVRLLLSVVKRLRCSGRQVGSVCPQYVDRNTGVSFSFQVMLPGKFFYSSVSGEQADPWIEIVTNISSGCLVTRQVVSVIGGMKEELFIDYVDTEWCLRARAGGFEHYGTSATQLSHRLGDGSFPIWVFGWRPFSIYSPQRLYYRFRNFVLVCRMPHVPLRWSIRTTWYWLGNFYAYSIFPPNRFENIKMMALGLWHGIRGSTGKYFSD